MTYQVLARKWRPRSFADMVGQEPILRALINGLEQGRLHHAYLFTGTRGVGKTTLARIIAKCLNCATKVSATPCGTCANCQAIDEGRFIDLIEIDAASRTKVEDTREVLDNVPFAPTQGRYKIYLIDEVHMLSGHSFNALLKTLEEPPEHVKFLLATTDPQKLPITVLSRCLQFNLKILSPALIQYRLHYILQQEQIACDKEALSLLAYAANGSVRDALSLLDQAIAFGNGEVNINDVKQMLGSIDETYIFKLVAALINKDAIILLQISQTISERAIDFAKVLEELLLLFHKIALSQITPEIVNILQVVQAEQISIFAHQLAPEDVQLYYQIALIGRRDLPLAATQKTGFEMVLLRMLSFVPNDLPSPKMVAIPPKKIEIKATPTNDLTATIKSSSRPADLWPDILLQLKLTGLAHTLAAHCMLIEKTEKNIELAIDSGQSALLNSKMTQVIEEALQKYFNQPLKLSISVANIPIDSPMRQQQIAHANQIAQATAVIESDPNVQSLLKTFNGKIQSHSIKLRVSSMEE